MKRRLSYTRLGHGDSVPDGEPRRDLTREGYVVLRWNVAPYEVVECLEHRLVMGLPPRGVHVHHINHDKADNRVENLALIEPGDHAARHQAERSAELDALVPEMVEMREAGMSYAAIARKFGCSAAFVSKRVRRAMGVAKETRAPACRNGHPYTEENTYRRKSGRRECRTCQRERDRADVATAGRLEGATA